MHTTKNKIQALAIPFQNAIEEDHVNMLVKQAEEERDLANEKFEEEERRHQKACALLAEMQNKIKEVCFIFVGCVCLCLCVCMCMWTKT
jgi:hypothetical protein